MVAGGCDGERQCLPSDSAYLTHILRFQIQLISWFSINTQKIRPKYRAAKQHVACNTQEPLIVHDLKNKGKT